MLNTMFLSNMIITLEDNPSTKKKCWLIGTDHLSNFLVQSLD